MFEYGWSQPWGQGPLGFVAGAAVGLWGTFDCFWGAPMCAATRPFWNDQRFCLESLGAEHEGTFGLCSWRLPYIWRASGLKRKKGARLPSFLGVCLRGLGSSGWLGGRHACMASICVTGTSKACGLGCVGMAERRASIFNAKVGSKGLGRGCGC